MTRPGHKWRLWTEAEIRLLHQQWLAETPVKAMDLPGRTPGDIRIKICKLRKADPASWPLRYSKETGAPVTLWLTKSLLTEAKARAKGSVSAYVRSLIERDLALNNERRTATAFGVESGADTRPPPPGLGTGERT
jgi:hypothetical protein